jgi:hypothetical protein
MAVGGAYLDDIVDGLELYTEAYRDPTCGGKSGTLLASPTFSTGRVIASKSE